MARALSPARAVRGHVWPHPPVGCVIVKDGAIIAGAATHPGGRPHAEPKAPGLVVSSARGTTRYAALKQRKEENSPQSDATRHGRSEAARPSLGTGTQTWRHRFGKPPLDGLALSEQRDARLRRSLCNLCKIRRRGR